MHYPSDDHRSLSFVSFASHAALRLAVLARIAAATTSPVVIDLDGLESLDVPAIGSLIRIGRDVRERGGALALAGGSPSVRATLRLTALDRVFPDLDPTPSASVTRRRGAGARIASALLAAAIAACTGAAPVVASPERGPVSAVEIVANVVAQNPEMRTYQAQLAVDLHMKSFPWLSQHLDATTYFKRPNNYEVVFHDVPSYAKGFEKLYSDIDDPSGWDKRFVMTVVGVRTVGHRQDIVLRLVQRVRGMIDHQDVAIDAEHWRIDGMEWHYYNGGEIAMTQDFVNSGPYTVLAAQHATIRIPHISASAEAAYTNYRTNVPIDDAVFAKSSGQAAQ